MYPENIGAPGLPGRDSATENNLTTYSITALAVGERGERVKM